VEEVEACAKGNVTDDCETTQRFQKAECKSLFHTKLINSLILLAVLTRPSREDFLYKRDTYES
jgi:hypothetical protein